MDRNFVIVRGGGDIATGTVLKLHNCGFLVLVLETGSPAAIRRNVSFSEAVYTGSQTVEGVRISLADDIEHAVGLLERDGVAVLVDPAGESIWKLKPFAVIDGIMAKRNLGTRIDMAPVTVAMGPGFTAGKDVHAVIETKRGHSLGRIIWEGEAAPNTGIPGDIGGFTSERVIHSPAAGVMRNIKGITESVTGGDIIAYVDTEDGAVPVTASISGILRGLIYDGYEVTKGFKIADIDPRVDERENCFTVSDKARCIAGGVLEALLTIGRKIP